MSSSIAVNIDFANECLERHNFFRIRHGVPRLKYSKRLTDYAQEWAEVIAKEDSMRHRPNPKYGENIFVKWSSDPTHKITAKEAVDSWYSEIKYFNFGIGGFSTKTGHFTQVVWKESKALGVGTARSGSDKIFVVANYDPPGNVQGAFAANVLPPRDFQASR